MASEADQRKDIGRLQGVSRIDEAAAQSTTLVHGHQYGDIAVADSASVQIGDVIHYHSYLPLPPANTVSIPIRSTSPKFTGSYAHSSIQPVAAYVPRPRLENELNEQLPVLLDTNSDETRTVVVWGFGGVGKSQLILNHIRLHRQQYQAIFWIESGQRETIERDYIQIYKQFIAHARNNSVTVSPEDAIMGVKNWLQNQDKRCLWVMDSADEVEDEESELYVDLNYYFPDAPRLDRIITTRSSHVQELSTQKSIAVGEMSEDEAAQLFRRYAKLRRIGEKAESDIRMIVEELGYLALAITLAGSYVSETPRIQSDLQLYLHRYRAQRKQFLGHKARYNVHRYRNNILSTWEMSFAAIERQNPIAANLFTLLAFTNFDDIFLQLFKIPETIENSSIQEEGRNSNGRWLRLLSPDGTTVDDNAVETAFATLEAYSLVAWRQGQDAYVMHKLVHAWSHDRLNLDQQRKWSFAVLELLGGVVKDCEGDLAKELRLMPHMVANFAAVSSVYASTCQTSQEDRDLIRLVAKFFHRIGRWHDEGNAWEFLLQQNKLALGPEHVDTLVAMGNLAVALQSRGLYEEAERMYRQTIELKCKVLGSEHSKTLTTMNNLGNLLSEKGHYEEAERIHRQTLRVQQETLPPEHQDTILSMECLSLLLSRWGKYIEAEKLQREILDLYQKVVGPQDPEILSTMCNLGTTLCNLGRYEEAEKIQRQTLELQQKISGLDHPDTLIVMNGLAITLNDLGRDEEAERIYRQTLDIRQKVLGVWHPHTLTTMNNLAKTLSDLGQYEEAEKIQRETIEIKKETLGLEHPSTLTSFSNLGVMLSEHGQYEKAEELLRQTLFLRQKFTGPDHPLTISCLHSLGWALKQLGQYKEAEQLLRQSLDFRRKVLGPEHPLTLNCMHNVGSLLQDSGQYTEAENVLRQTLELRRKVLGPEHVDTQQTMYRLEEFKP